MPISKNAKGGVMGSKKLWCVAMRPEYDSPFKQSPAASKELAEQAVARYRKLHHRMFHSEVIANAYDEWFQVQQWHGTRKDHIRKMFYVQDWFNQPMFQIFDMSRAVDIFSREDIVICYKKGSVPIVTKDIEEARHFYKVRDGKKPLEPIEVIRSEMGTWTHPIYIDRLCEMIGDKEYITKDEWDNFRKELNIDTVTFWMESSVNSDDWETMMDDCDITKWEPIAPNGFFLIDINFSEDDAYAIFARNKHESEVA